MFNDRCFSANGFEFFDHTSERLNLGGNFEYLDLGDAKINNSRTLKGDYKRNEAFFLALNANWTF